MNRFRWAGVILIALAVGLGACSSQGGRMDRPVVDERTEALVSLSAAHHKRADLALAQGVRADAKSEMTDLISVARKAGLNTAEAWDVRFDASGRLARLHLEDNELAQAETAVVEGLEGSEGAPATLVHGHLYQIYGDVLEKKGDARGAVTQHGRAIEVFKVILNRGAP
jgi:hypothetical protein